MNAVRVAAEPVYQRLGRYELLGEIASGGMATVYLGRVVGAKGFSRLVAIKKLHPHLERHEEFVAMFLDEARLAARIRHPNVVPTLDVEDRDGLYIVMEYVEGDRLLGLIKHAAKRQARLPIPLSLRIAVETLAGLHAAHELLDDDGRPLQIVHRDVSPQNVLVGVDGITKITDFGIAKAESRLSQTREGQLKGKIAYMAPEQTRRGPGNLDRRVDIFAAGIVTWEMLTGRRLFRGETDVEVFSALTNDPIPSPRTLNPDVSEELATVVLKALAREPDDRWPTAIAFAEALEQAAATTGGLASTRTVAQYVQEVAGPKLEQERARLRAGLALGSLTDHVSSPSGPRVDEARSGSRPRPDWDAGPPARSTRPRLTIVLALVAITAISGAIAFWAATRRPAGSTTATSPTAQGMTSASTQPAVLPATPPAPVATATPPAANNTDAGTAAPSTARAVPGRRRPVRPPRNTPRGNEHPGEDDEPISSNPYRQ